MLAERARDGSDALKGYRARPKRRRGVFLARAQRAPECVVDRERKALQSARARV